MNNYNKQIYKHGKFCLVSARLSLDRHPLFPYYCQSKISSIIKKINVQNK